MTSNGFFIVIKKTCLNVESIDAIEARFNGGVFVLFKGNPERQHFDIDFEVLIEAMNELNNSEDSNDRTRNHS